MKLIDNLMRIANSMSLKVLVSFGLVVQLFEAPLLNCATHTCYTDHFFLRADKLSVFVLAIWLLMLVAIELAIKAKTEIITQHKLHTPPPFDPAWAKSPNLVKPLNCDLYSCGNDT